MSADTKIYSCSTEKLEDLFARIAEIAVLYIPTDCSDGAVYAEWKSGMKLSTAKNTNLSAKGFFFPQTENLMEFKKSGKKLEIKAIRPDDEKFVLFGVRACDAASFGVLDRVFMQGKYTDSYYSMRRKNATLFTLACNEPRDTCFCTNFGIDAAEPGGDVECHIWGGNLYMKALTEKGENTLSALYEMTEVCGADAVDSIKSEIRRKLGMLPLSNLPVRKFGAGKTNEYFDAPEWKELSQTCLGCGSCTYVCPTCQCFDIRDYDTGNGIIRFRCWDSCMYSDFTKMSAGQPRITRAERFRQRFMHKLIYFPENNDGVFGCVGCGRCLERCPISMNIVKVARTLANKSDCGERGESNGEHGAE